MSSPEKSQQETRGAPPPKKTAASVKKTTKSAKSTKKRSPIRIVYLGWGSLIWDSADLKIHEWQHTDLKLPLEFSRVSDGGYGRLTLVIDPKNGTENRVWVADTEHKNINTALKAIRKREGSKNPRSIAYIDIKKGTQRVTNTPPHLVQRIKDYANKHEYDVVIWTDLPSNWVELKFCAYTNDNVLNYYRFLPMPMQIKALNYIYQAIRQAHIKTKFSQFLFQNLDKFAP